MVFRKSNNKRKLNLLVYWTCPICGAMVTDFRNNHDLWRQRVHNHLTNNHYQIRNNVLDEVEDFFEQVKDNQKEEGYNERWLKF